ncbi:hypothetical protein DPMN_030000 [Dreissena polymorpha]|uniref:Fibronectin type-III domain-containing protein n=1 Tax=Dreissena polymorpha TaxID=45954 RepID=A0A9D4RGM1_DREPO|nr:hypothetical protein DPMN_029857 [Dreissena polymorpha]KAH3866877.1 hypothetical protein DPMN_030000 [Dreissena polymorpha]
MIKNIYFICCLTFQIHDPDARSLQVTNLKPYTYYQLRIIAVNIVGRSQPSNASRQFQTMQAAPNIPPGNLTVRTLNATALRISWTVGAFILCFG